MSKNIRHLKSFKLIAHLFIVSFLTILTQVGGLIWILVHLTFKFFNTKKSKRLRLATFVITYLLFTLAIIPQLSKLNSRVALPIGQSQQLVPHTYLTVLLNRHYVKPELKDVLIDTAIKFAAKNPGLQIKYLDANFPFFNGFPLLPHLSHSDGKKVDLAFQYLKDSNPSNDKPSRSGYGVFAQAKSNEVNQSNNCKSKGYWQYDYPKYLSFGTRKGFEFDGQRTKDIMALLLTNPKSQKLFVEPHLKARIGLQSSKIRYQGCHSVRHDDHIHFQIK